MMEYWATGHRRPAATLAAVAQPMQQEPLAQTVPLPLEALARYQSLLLLGNLLQETSPTRASGAPDLAALLAEC